ncbi:hypothetical protein QQ045_028189 [Rhodiola kirilowii]
MKQHHQLSGSSSATKMILLPPSYLRSNSCNNHKPMSEQINCLSNSSSHNQSPRNNSDASSTALQIHKRAKGGRISSLISSLLSVITIPSSFFVPAAACRWLTASIISSASSAISAFRPLAIGGQVTTGTLFGYRKGRVFLAIQDHPRSEPFLILDLPMSTSALVKAMSSGFVRIALECDKAASFNKTDMKRNNKLLQELEWTMYCNSRKCGIARSMECMDFATFVLATVGSISVGAGVIPVVSHGTQFDSGPLMYMRARFERAVGNRDSEAFYMLNPDGHAGGPELSIFLLRL